MLKNIILDSDPHNFGKKVTRIQRASGTWYRKPRPTFWENLFFGIDSPLKNFFAIKGTNGKSQISNYFFNLIIDPIDNWNGNSKEIVQSCKNPIGEHFYSFGALLAYCYIFGIRDLHRNNLIFTDTHLQVIDAEVVNTNLILPQETILLPFKDIEFNQCALSLIIKTITSLNSIQKKEILAGFIDCLLIIKNSAEEISSITRNIDLKLIPIRVIIRNTRDYKNHLDGSKVIHDFIPEELDQLSRGDIPYFFKFISNPNLFWISADNNEYESVKDLTHYKTDVARHACSPNELISASIIEKRLIHGLMYLSKLLEIDKNSFEFGNRTIFLKKEEICFTNPSQKYTSKK